MLIPKQQCSSISRPLRLGFLLFLFSFLTTSTLGFAQNPLRLLFRKQGSQTKHHELQLRSEEQLSKRLLEVRKRESRFERQRKEKREQLKSQLARYRALVQKHTQKLRDRELRSSMRIQQQRANIVQVATKGITLLESLDSAWALHAQVLSQLENSLRSYIKYHQQMSQWIKNYYGNKISLDQLKRDLKLLQKKVQKNKKILEKLHLRENTLLQQKHAVDATIENLRQKLIHPDLNKNSKKHLRPKITPLPKIPSKTAPTPSRSKPVKKPKPAPKPEKSRAVPNNPFNPPSLFGDPSQPRTRPIAPRFVPKRQAPEPDTQQQQQQAAPVLNKMKAHLDRTLSLQEQIELQKKRRKHSYIQQINEEQKRLQFWFSRDQLQFLQLSIEDCRLEHEYIQTRAETYRFLANALKQKIQSLAEVTKGGFLYKKPFSLRWSSLKNSYKHTGTLLSLSTSKIKAVPAETVRMWKSTQKKLGQFFYPGFIASFLFVLGLYFLLKGRVNRVTAYAKEQQEEHEHHEISWLAVGFFSKILSSIFIPCLLLVLAALFVWFGQFEEDWTRQSLQVLSSFIFAWSLWNIASATFSRNKENRFFKQVEDDSAGRLRRSIRLFALGFLLIVPLMQLTVFLGYPEEFSSLLGFIFFTISLFSFLLFIFNKKAILSIFPEKTRAERSFLLLLRTFYGLLPLIAFGLYSLYIVGYHNLAGYLTRGVLFSGLLFFGLYTTYQSLWALSYWLLRDKENEDEEGQEKKNRKWKRRTIRATRFLSGLTLLFIGLSLGFEIWGIADGYQSTLGFLYRPLFKVRETEINLVSLFKFSLSLSLSIWFAGFSRRNLTELVYPLFQVSRANQHAFNTVLGYAIVVIGILFGLQWMGVGFGILAVFAGVIGIGIGFGLQNITNNFISGLIITFGRPFKVGDLIEVNGVLGEVLEINARSTMIMTMGKRLTLVPNSDLLTSQVINWSMGPQHILIKMLVGVAYGSNVEEVKEALLEIANGHPKILKSPEAYVTFNDFGASTLDFLLWTAIKDPLDRFRIQSDLRFSIDKVFAEKQIEIAFPQQDIHLNKNLEEALIQSFQPNSKKLK